MIVLMGRSVVLLLSGRARMIVVVDVLTTSTKNFAIFLVVSSDKGFHCNWDVAGL